MPEQAITFTIRDARVIWPNFAGEEKQYNTKGDRNFCLVLDDDFAEQLEADGWNVKTRQRPDDPEFEPFKYLQVAVRFDVRPPNIQLVTSGPRQQLTEDTVEILDYADIFEWNVVVRAREWQDERDGGKTKIKAYLKTLFAKQDEDELEREFALMDAENSSDVVDTVFPD